MASHDVRKTIADLRDHLARHDKPIAFLLGAGTSCAVKAVGAKGGEPETPLIPAVAGLTAICDSEVRSLGKEYAEAWTKVVRRLRWELSAVLSARQPSEAGSGSRLKLGPSLEDARIGHLAP
jgi:hypothetical protein